jgi:hypothetical protein
MSETKGRNREGTNRGCCLSIALHPFLTRPQSTRHFSDDSGQVLDLAPNRRGFSYRCDFGGQQFVDSALPAKKSPFCTGVRSCSELLARLLMASAPLPRKIECKENARKKRTGFLMGYIEKSATAREV